MLPTASLPVNRHRRGTASAWNVPPAPRPRRATAGTKCKLNEIAEPSA